MFTPAYNSITIASFNKDLLIDEDMLLKPNVKTLARILKIKI